MAWPPRLMERMSGRSESSENSARQLLPRSSGQATSSTPSAVLADTGPARTPETSAGITAAESDAAQNNSTAMRMQRMLHERGHAGGPPERINQRANGNGRRGDSRRASD